MVPATVWIRWKVSKAASGKGGANSVVMHNINIYTTKKPAMIGRKEAESKVRAADATTFVVTTFVVTTGEERCAL